MTSTTAQAILALATHDDALPMLARNAVLAALLPNTWVHGTRTGEQSADYVNVAQAINNRNNYDEYPLEYAAIMLDAGTILGDRDAYQVDDEGTIGLDPALAVEPEREAWDARARDIAERMAQAELDAHAETVIRS